MVSIHSAQSGRDNASRPVSRVLSRRVAPPWMTIHLERPSPDASRNLPGRLGRKQPWTSLRTAAPPLFGLAPGGVCHAAPVAEGAVRSYRTISPLRQAEARFRGFFSVALSLGSPPPGVTRHRVSMEPGLSSPAPFRALRQRSSSQLAEEEVGACEREWQSHSQPLQTSSLAPSGHLAGGATALADAGGDHPSNTTRPSHTVMRGAMPL